jgi:hypothetical protein
VTVAVADPPWLTVKKPGEILNHSMGSHTLKESKVVADKPPEVPVMVSIVVPTGVEALTLTVSMLPPVVGSCVHEAVTPGGSGEVMARLMFPVKPL